MKQTVRKNKSILWYTLYGFLLTAALMYYRFPSSEIRDYIEAAAARANPSLLLSVEKVTPSLPPGLEIMKIKLSLRERPKDLLLRSAKLSIRPELLSLLQGDPKYAFDARAYKGKAKGTLHFRENNPGTPFTTQIQLKDIDIGESAYLTSLIGHGIAGILGGTLTYEGRSPLLIDGTGEADLRITDGRVALSEPILSFETLTFTEFSLKIVLKNRRLDLAGVELKGREVQGTLSGTIGLKEQISKSTLNLRGEIEPLAGILKSIGGDKNTLTFLRRYLKKGSRSFTIKGTFGKPKFRLT